VLALERSRAGDGQSGVTLLRRAVERKDRAVVEGIVKVGREGENEGGREGGRVETNSGRRVCRQARLRGGREGGREEGREGG